MLELDARFLAIKQLDDVGQNNGFAGAVFERQGMLLGQRDECALDVFETEADLRSIIALLDPDHCMPATSHIHDG